MPSAFPRDALASWSPVLIGPRLDDLLLFSATARLGHLQDYRRLSGANELEKKMQDGPDDADKLKARLAKLASDLQAHRAASESSEARKAEADLTDKGLGQAMGLGFRVLSEFVAAIVVSTLIGWRFDLWFGTDPFLLILFMGLGVAAGFWNVYRLAAPPQDPRGKK